MKLISNIFSDLRKLIQEKDRLFTAQEANRRKEEQLRNFYNGQDLYTEEELKEMGQTENTNHLLGYRNLSAAQSTVVSLYTGTSTFIDISANFGNMEADAKVSAVLTRYLNEAIYTSGRLESVWQSVGGELVLTGKAPLVFDRHGWCPRIAPNLLVPEESTSTANGIDYAFAPYELTLSRLNALKGAVKGKSRHISVQNVERLIQQITENISDGKQTAVVGIDNKGKELLNQSLGDEGMSSEPTNKIRAWKYYERYFDEQKSSYCVSCTLFTEEVQPKEKAEGETSEPLIISSVRREYDSADYWLHVIMSDSRIGGRKTYGDAMGIAELTFASDAHLEALVNEQIEGDMQRATPKWRVGENADINAVNRWDVSGDRIVPRGVEAVQVWAAGNLMTPINLLTHTSSGLSGGSYSNTGRNQELRTQAVERQSQSASLMSDRLAAVTTAGNRLVTEIVRRFLVDDISPRHDEYNDVMWFRAQVEAEDLGIPLKKLAEMQYGRFKFLKVKMAAAVGDGSRTDEVSIAGALMENISNFSPEARPGVMKRWLTMITRNPRLAEELVEVPKPIINGQRITAENEFDTIRRRAALGERIPIADDDIDANHVATHAKDIKAFIAELSMRQPGPLDVVHLTGLFDHTSLHLDRMDSIEVSRNEATQWRGVVSNLFNEAKPILEGILADQEQAGQQDGQQMTLKERADFALKQGKLVLDAKKVSLAERQQDSLEEDRANRIKMGGRKQYSSEVTAAEKLRLEQEKLDNSKKTKGK